MGHTGHCSKLGEKMFIGNKSTLKRRGEIRLSIFNLRHLRKLSHFPPVVVVVGVDFDDVCVDVCLDVYIVVVFMLLFCSCFDVVL